MVKMDDFESHSSLSGDGEHGAIVSRLEAVKIDHLRSNAVFICKWCESNASDTVESPPL